MKRVVDIYIKKMLVFITLQLFVGPYGQLSIHRFYLSSIEGLTLIKMNLSSYKYV